MSGKSKGGNTISKVWKIAEPIAIELGLEIWDIKFVKEGAEHYLRIFIDKEEGVCIDDCVDMTHAINDPLDEADPIDCSYCLEVSSPGIERQLSRPEHYEKMMGERIKVRLIKANDNLRDFNGVLNSFDNGQITLILDNGEEKVIDKKQTSWVKLDDFEM